MSKSKTRKTTLEVAKRSKKRSTKTDRTAAPKVANNEKAEVERVYRHVLSIIDTINEVVAALANVPAASEDESRAETKDPHAVAKAGPLWWIDKWGGAITEFRMCIPVEIQEHVLGLDRVDACLEIRFTRGEDTAIVPACSPGKPLILLPDDGSGHVSLGALLQDGAKFKTLPLCQRFREWSLQLPDVEAAHAQWVKDAKNHKLRIKKVVEQCARDEEAFDRNPPTVAEFAVAATSFIAACSVHARERSDGVKDEGRRYIERKFTQSEDSPQPEVGATVFMIEHHLRKRWPLIHEADIEAAIDKLDRDGRIKLLPNGHKWLDVTYPVWVACTTSVDLPVLSLKQAAVYEMLVEHPPYRGMTGPEIIDELQNRGIFTDQSTLTSRIIPALCPYGIENAPRIGYRIPPTKRPE